MKVLLIEPGTEVSINIPYALLQLAAVLRENNIDVIVKNYSGKPITKEKLAKEFEKIDFDIIGVKVITSPIVSRAIMISEVAKELGKKVIWGGPHPTILPKQCLEHPAVDAVVIGEAENSFLELINHYRNHNGSKLLGCGIKDSSNNISIMPPREEFVDLDELPIPAWDLVDDIDRYFPYKKDNIVPIATSRGCIFNCGFCHQANENVNAYGGRFRVMSAKKMLKEFDVVDSLTRKHLSRIYLLSDLHLANPTYVRKFCSEMVESNKDVTWISATRYDCIKPEMIDMAVNAGCDELLFGVESGSPRIQKILGKVIDKEKAIRTAIMLRERGVFITNAYIFGHPGETIEELRETIKWINEIPADQNLVQLCRPLPGTPYFNKYIDEGKFKAPERVEDWATFGVAGYDTNISNIPTRTLNYLFWKNNFFYQLGHHINLQKFYLRRKMYEQFFNTFVNNKFIFKFKEILSTRKYMS